MPDKTPLDGNEIAPAGDNTGQVPQTPGDASQARETGVPEETLSAISEAWQTWASRPDGWISILHGELLCTA